LSADAAEDAVAEYEIFDAPPEGHPGLRATKWKRVIELDVGKALIVPWHDVDMYLSESAVRSAVWEVGRRTKRRFETHKTDRGLMIIRRK
jgi:hypothetical protein